MKTRVVTYVVLLLIVITWSVGAQETTGPAIEIKRLVESIDQEITRFERESAGYEDEKVRLQIEADEIYRRLMSASDDLQRAAINADFLYNSAEQNRADYRYVELARSVLYELVPRLSRLADQVEAAGRLGFASSREYEVYQSRMESFLKNSSQILSDVIRNVDDPSLKKSVKEAALALRSTRFGLSGVNQNVSASVKEVHETINLLELAFAELGAISQSLLSEKFSLQLAGYKSMTRLVLNQLGGTLPLSSEKMGSFVKSSQAEVLKRNSRLQDAMSQVEGGDPAFTGTDYITDNELKSLIDEVSQ